MNRIITAVVALTLALLSGCASLPSPRTGDVLAIIHLNGEIDDAAAAVARTAVDHVVADANVKAVLVMVDSGGGDVYASAAIYDEFARIKVPVVAYCESMCASGALYAIMSPSVRAIAINQQTIIGSVGVIRTVLRRELPPNVTILKSGKFKQAGNVAPATPGEDEYLQHEIADVASIFYDVVRAARGRFISPDAWVHIKNAEIFFGKYGVQVGLADAVMSRRDAVQFATTFAHSDSIVAREYK